MQRYGTYLLKLNIFYTHNFKEVDLPCYLLILVIPRKLPQLVLGVKSVRFG